MSPDLQQTAGCLRYFRSQVESAPNWSWLSSLTRHTICCVSLRHLHTLHVLHTCPDGRCQGGAGEWSGGSSEGWAAVSIPSFESPN